MVIYIYLLFVFNIKDSRLCNSKKITKINNTSTAAILYYYDYELYRFLSIGIYYYSLGTNTYNIICSRFI